MERYRNAGGDSGIVAYEIGCDSIWVAFNDGSRYLYTGRSAGQSNIESMKALATAGLGLNSFINTHVRMRYASKSRGGRGWLLFADRKRSLLNAPSKPGPSALLRGRRIEVAGAI